MDLTHRSQHFEFGKNWSDYSKKLDEDRRASAVESVRALVGNLNGKSFLDIGSGSGLFSLAALRLGASNVRAIDLDENSVATTRAVLGAAGEQGRWTAEQKSVFDLSAEQDGQFDVVYSWGVLHHTGDMWNAIDRAAQLVKPGGTLALALYEKTPLCGFWKKEKRFYMRSGPKVQKALRGVYAVAYGSGLTLSGRNPFKRLREMRVRGMDTMHDVHDWLGGFPYESTSAKEVEAFLRTRGFESVLVKPVPVRAMGLGGSGCSEYVYRRTS